MKRIYAHNKAASASSTRHLVEFLRNSSGSSPSNLHYNFTELVNESENLIIIGDYHGNGHHYSWQRECHYSS